MKRICSLGFMLFLFILSTSYRAHGATYTAASCQESAVNAVINGPTHIAVNGDTIVIPAGTCTWTSNLTGPSGVGFTLTGTGTPNSNAGSTGASSSCTGTQIIDNSGSSTFLMSFTPTYGASPMRISCMDIEPVSTSATLYAPIQVDGTCTSSGCPPFRIDNVTFGLNTQWVESNNGAQAAAMIRVNDVFGVMDHNTIPNGSNVELFNAQMYSYLGVGAYGDNSWAQPDSLGGPNNIFAENNLFYSGYLGMNDCEAGAIGGCRVVLRYNTVTESSTGAWGIFENHGTETAGRGRSGREAEVYNNTLTCLGACTAVEGGLRGGTGMFFGNHAILTPGQGANTWLGISLYRTVFTAVPWGACGGSAAWDLNDGVVYYSGVVGSSSNGGLTLTDYNQNWIIDQLVPAGNPYSVYNVTQGWWGEIAGNTATSITVKGTISEQSSYGFNAGDSYRIQRSRYCLDQPGRGQGSYISGDTPAQTGYPNQALDPIYQWGDYATGGANVNSPISSNSAKIIANRDYYPQAAGIQTSPILPFNGTSGTGWGTLANRPPTCTTGVGYFATDQGSWNTSGSSSGVLYKCSSTNSWTLGYTPYTYPHPLITGNSGSSSTPPSPPLSVTATVR